MNEGTDEQVAQYLHLDFWLIWPTVQMNSSLEAARSQQGERESGETRPKTKDTREKRNKRFALESVFFANAVEMKANVSDKKLYTVFSLVDASEH